MLGKLCCAKSFVDFVLSAMHKAIRDCLLLKFVKEDTFLAMLYCCSLPSFLNSAAFYYILPSFEVCKKNTWHFLGKSFCAKSCKLGNMEEPGDCLVLDTV